MNSNNNFNNYKDSLNIQRMTDIATSAEIRANLADAKANGINTSFSYSPTPEQRRTHKLFLAYSILAIAGAWVMFTVLSATICFFLMGFGLVVWAIKVIVEDKSSIKPEDTNKQ